MQIPSAQESLIRYTSGPVTHNTREIRCRPWVPSIISPCTPSVTLSLSVQWIRTGDSRADRLAFQDRTTLQGGQRTRDDNRVSLHRKGSGMPRSKLWLSLYAGILVLSLNASPLYAASQSGEFAYELLGNQTCDNFVSAREERSQEYYFFVGWVAGYLSGYNRFAEDTVDVTPWQGIELLTALLANFCGKNPDARFIDGVEAMIVQLAPRRLRNTAESVEAKSGDNTVVAYKIVMKRAQSALMELGFYEGTIDGQFGEGTLTAFKAFQASKNLEQNGIPDQKTLYELFR